MSETLEAVQRLVAVGDVRISEHGYDELANDGIPVRDILEGISSARVVEDYPAFGKGPAVLVLESDAQGKPVHVVWGVAKEHASPAVPVTAYRPDPGAWSALAARFMRQRAAAQLRRSATQDSTGCVFVCL